MDLNSLYGRNNAAHYRAKAEECRREAKKAYGEDLRKAYLELAVQWDDLARQAEEL